MTRRSWLFIKSPLALPLAVAATSCVTDAERRQRRQARIPPPHIDRLFPAGTAAGVGFGVQASGESAIGVAGNGFRHGARLRLNGTRIETTFGGAGSLSAIVAADWYKRPGVIEVTVVNPDGQVSSPVPFTVFAPGGAAPEIKRLWPADAVAGKSVNPQPDGSSALGIEGANFLPGSEVLLNGRSAVSTYAGPNNMSAILPSELLSRPGTVDVTVRNPNGESSKPLQLRVTRK